MGRIERLTRSSGANEVTPVRSPHGSDLRRVTGGPWSYAQPAWSSDGRTLLVYELREEGSWEGGHVAAVAVPGRGGDE